MIEVARAIEGLPYLDPNDPRPQEEPEFFTMAAVAYRCGTPGCIAGWAERLLRCPKGREPPPIHDEREALVGAAERFGITAKQAFWRFDPRFERADVAAMPIEGGHLRRARCGGGWSRVRPRPRTAASRRSGVRARREDALEPIEGTPLGEGRRTQPRRAALLR